MDIASIRARSGLSLVLAVIVFGSVWGLMEMTLGGFLHTIHFAHKGAVMGGMAISLMAVFLSVTRRPLLVPALGLIAASFKPFSAFIFGQPVTSAYVVNPATAIFLESLAFALAAVVLHRAMETRVTARIGAGFLAGALGIVLYAAVASTLGMGKWPVMDLAVKIGTIVDTGVPVALAGSVMLVLGNAAGKFGLPRLSGISALYPRFYHASLIALVVFCWVIPPVFGLGG
ncbi:hypothetical protein ABFB09_00810 [Dehalogenimonas sp. THU2]|uniref:hypothetical protein n=1 Tax=Dehalogenimonas sp. THU2 TaxID=3151121 RepID=UPI003218B81C